MVCPTCSRENLADALFCAGCGAPLSFACSNCGRDLTRDASFCDRCGTPVSGDAASAPASAEETAAPGHRTEHPTSFANGRYQVKAFLGEGGKKRVYQAHDTVLDRDIALAVIKTEGLDPTSRVRITREAQAMGRLGDHPHVLQIFDLGDESGQPYMVLPLMTGGDVGTLLEAAEDHKLPLEQAIDLAAQICRGLEFAHSKSIVHRDLKPGNIWLTSDGTAKIGDFGLAVAIDRSRLTQEGMMVGTVSYMPPEQAMGGDVTPQSDLYSLGAMLYEMVCGRPPFLGDDSVAIIGQHINTPPVAPTWHNSECPRALEALILRLLAKNPSERPESAADVLTALEGIDLTASDQPSAEHDEAHALDSLAGGVFVGRQREMGELKAALEDTLSGRGRLVTLVGEPGIGKTRTAQELATYAGLRGCQVLWGRCHESRGAPPYWPWVQAVRSYVRERDPERLRSEMGTGAADIAEIVSDVRERIPDLKPSPAVDDPEQARFRLFDSITAFLKTASRSQPLAIILDNLHWADKPSLLLLEFLAQEFSDSRLLVIGTYRDVDLSRQHPLAETLGELTRERLFQRVLLRGLSQQDVGRFIEVTTGIAPPASLVRAVHTQTEGNPLFVTEVVRLLVQEGELTQERESWDVRIPEGVREVIGRRLNRLTDRCNETLTVAAVIGREFELRQLEGLIEDLSQDRLLEVLEEALSARVIQELPRAVGRYEFTHALIQQTLYDELTTTRRVRLHARILEVLEELYGPNVDAHAVELAHHAAEAEAVIGSEKVVQYSKLAGERALAAYAYEEALSYFERALGAKEGQPTDAETAALHLGLGRAQFATLERVQLQEAVNNLIRAFDYYVETGDVDQAVAVAHSPTLHLITLTGITKMLARALEMVPSDSYQAGSLLLAYARQLGLNEADYEGAREAFDRALAVAQREQDTTMEMRALAYAAWVDRFHLQLRESLNNSLRVIKLADKAGDPGEGEAPLYYAHTFAAASLLVIGDPEGARPHAAALLPLAERLHERALLTRAYSPNAEVSRLKGEWEATRDFSDRGLALQPRFPLLLGSRVVLEYEVGEFSQGEVYLERLVEAIRLVPPGPNWESSIPAVVIPVVERITGIPAQFEVARKAAETVISSPSATPVHVMTARAGLALTAVQRDDVAAAGEQYAAIESQRNRMVSWVLISADRLLGLLAQTMGNLGDAAGHFEDALAFCRKAEYRAELAWSLCDYADMVRESDDGGDRQKAATLLEESLAISSELGMRPLIERVLSRKMSLQGIDISSPETSIEAVVSAVEVERPNLQPHAAPDGTVTIMFTDIENFTPMNERLGDKLAQEVVRAHNTVVRQQIAAHQGFEVKSQGDGFMVAFSSARRALECAIAIQQALVARNEEHQDEPIRVRIGLHTGEAIKEGEDFFGKTVILAARIASQAVGGQILVSSLLKALVESSGEFDFAEGRDVKLKGMTGSHQVFEVNLP